MKRKIFIVLTTLLILLLTACNKQIFDTTWNFDYAYIKMPDGSVIQGKVDSWDDFDDSDAVQIKINGVTYLTHYCNVVMVDK